MTCYNSKLYVELLHNEIEQYNAALKHSKRNSKIPSMHRFKIKNLLRYLGKIPFYHVRDFILS